MFGVEYDRQASDFLRKSHKQLTGRITEKIEILRINPLTSGARRLKGKTNVFRARVGDYRILYSIDFIQKQITIAKIDHRKKVYDEVL